MTEGKPSDFGGSLPSEEALLAVIAPLADPLALRVVHRLAGNLLQGAPTKMPIQDLVEELGTDVAGLERSMAPLLENETLLWSRTASGEEELTLSGGELFRLAAALTVGAARRKG